MLNRFLNIAQIRHIEVEALSKHKLDLMDMAGAAIAKWVESSFSPAQKVLILIGRGNNGGDGVLAALKLKSCGYDVAIFKAAPQLNPTTENLVAQFIQQKGKVLNRLPPKLDGYTLIIDAILGIGINNHVDAKLSKLIDQVNHCGQYVLAVDTPTGLDPFSGQVYGNAIRARHTITFICDKPGFYTGDGIDLVGQLTIANLINLDEYTLPKASTIDVLQNDLTTIDYQVLARKVHNTNKGTFGSVAIIGGSHGMHGSLYLAGRAAMLLGSGKVIIASLDEGFASDILMPELMLRDPKDVIKSLHDYSVVVIGPGLGNDSKALKLLTKLIKQKPQAKLIFDADALNLLAANDELHEDFRLIPNKVITPHPGEAARLLKTSVDVVGENRFVALKNMTTQFNAIGLLKGAGSLIQDNSHVYLNQTGNMALSNAGQGDTLCGIIAAFVAQGMGLSSALRFAVYLHGKAAEALVSTIGYNGVLATEVGLTARNLLNQLLYSSSEKS